MISGRVSVECAKCGNTSDPLGVMVDSTGALVCFWCKAPDSPTPPATLAAAWIVGDGYITEIACEDHAKIYADDYGLIWSYPDSTGDYGPEYVYREHYAPESDYPHTCYVCDAYLDTALTPDGVEYVREHYAPEWWPLWGVTA